MTNHGGPSQATRLLELLTDDIELFHTTDDVSYATIAVSGHHETWPVWSDPFQEWLARRFYQAEKSAPNGCALQDALTVISSKAKYDGLELPVFTRVADPQGNIYLDLGDPDWRAVEVTPSGWNIVNHPPVRFLRRNGMLALPAPVHGSQISSLRPFVNVKDEDFVLLVGWLIASLRPSGPYPVLALYGEQGSAKSTTAKVLRALVDPSKAPIRALPQNERDLVISADCSHILAFDNISFLNPWLSDAICRLSTGGGIAYRTLYKNDEVKIFDVQRPVLLNGIEDVAVRGDLLDRMVVLSLPEISENQRKQEDVLWKEFEAVRPQVLGALLNGVSAALKNIKTVKMDDKPRMADSAMWVTAAECELGFSGRDFMRAYKRNRREANDVAIEASPVATKVVAFMQNKNEWEGTTGELNNKANIHASSPRALTNALARVKPSLRDVGITIQLLPRQATKRLIRLEMKHTAPSVPSLPSQTQSNQQVPRDDGHDVTRDGSSGIDSASSDGVPI